MRVQNQDRHIVCALGFHNFLRFLLGIHLNVVIQADHQVIARNRLHPVFFRIFKLNSSGIGQCQDRSGDSFHIFIVLHFQSDDPLIVTPCKSKHLGRQLPIRIIPFEIFIHFYTVISVIANGISDLFLHIGFDPLNGADLLHPFPHRLFRQFQFLTEHVDHTFRVFDLTVDHGDSADRLVIRQHRSISIQDPASGCFDTPFPLMKIFRQLLIIFRFKNHQIHQSSCKDRQQKQTDAEHDHDLFSMKSPAMQKNTP